MSEELHQQIIELNKTNGKICGLLEGMKDTQNKQLDYLKTVEEKAEEAKDIAQNAKTHTGFLYKLGSVVTTGLMIAGGYIASMIKHGG